MAEPRRLVAVDPGLDGVGLAVFVPRPRIGEPVTLARVLSWLQDARTVETDPDDALPVRLHRVAAAVLEPGPDEVVVEVPAIEGRYARHRRRGTGPSPRALNRLYTSLGAIIAAAEAAGGVRAVRLLAADATSKKDRQGFLRAAARQVEGIELPRGPRGGLLEDAWDAVWIGCRWLTGGAVEWRDVG